MSQPLLLMGVVILICIVMNRFIQRLAVPSLLIFIALGMLFGENGLFRIPFDDYQVSSIICSVSLIFLMFYGGFGTNLSAARPVLAKSILLSTVFAIFAVLGGSHTSYNLFNLVFCIVLLSIALQGTLLPWVSRKLDMIDPAEDVSKTFNDYQEENDVDFVKVHIESGHPWIGRSLAELQLPHNLLAVMIARDGDNLVPDGHTVLQDGDLLVFAARAFEDRENLSLREIPIDRGHKWNNRTLREITTPQHTLIILIQRGTRTMIPDGGTRIQTGDILVLAQPGA